MGLHELSRVRQQTHFGPRSLFVRNAEYTEIAVPAIKVAHIQVRQAAGLGRAAGGFPF